MVGKSKRAINKDGSFNVVRQGGERGLRNIYQYLLQLSNFYFFILILLTYVVIKLYLRSVFFLSEQNI